MCFNRHAEHVLWCDRRSAGLITRIIIKPFSSIMQAPRNGLILITEFYEPPVWHVRLNHQQFSSVNPDSRCTIINVTIAESILKVFSFYVFNPKNVVISTHLSKHSKPINARSRNCFFKQTVYICIMIQNKSYHYLLVLHVLTCKNFEQVV